MPLSKEHVDYVYRNKRGSIVVKFIPTHILRNLLLDKSKSKSKTKPLMLKYVGYRATSNRLYANVHLLSETWNLSQQVGQFQKKYDSKISCTINQKAYLRKKKALSPPGLIA